MIEITILSGGEKFKYTTGECMRYILNSLEHDKVTFVSTIDGKILALNKNTIMTLREV